jgi:hypothetical protein
VRWADRHVTPLKVVLGSASVVLALSWGGQLLLPLFIPVYVWAARRSGPLGRALWSLPPAIGVGVAAWAAIYVTSGEPKPAIWLAPVLAAVGALGMLTWRATPVSHRGPPLT